MAFLRDGTKRVINQHAIAGEISKKANTPIKILCNA